MAQHIRSAKSANDWNVSDLVAYNINFLDLDAPEFFEVQNLPQVPIQGDFVLKEKWEDMHDETSVSLGFQMSLAMRGGDAVNLFTIKLLERIGYTSLFQQLVLHQDFPLHICGETKHAKMDLSLVKLSRDFTEGLTILLVQEDKRANEPDPLAQLIAGAIAVAAVNNRVRQRKGLEPLKKQVIPAISLVRTMPTFYKIPITTSLITSISQGQFPEERTQVLCHSPVGRSGMLFMDDRKRALRCYKEFYKYIEVLDVALSAV